MTDPDYRLSDAEREQVVDQLRRHCGDGRLTLDEFADRAGAAYAARTAPELAGLLDDLPSLAAPVPHRPRTEPTQQVTRSWVVGILNANRRRGRWRVDGPLTAFAFWGSSILDFRGAQIETPVVDVQAWAIMGGVEIVVPEGVPVEVDGFVLMGGVNDRSRGGSAVPGTPVIRVHCYGMWGGVSVVVKKAGSHETDSSGSRHHAHDHRHVHGRDHLGPAAPPPPALPSPSVHDQLPPLPSLPPPPARPVQVGPPVTLRAEPAGAPRPARRADADPAVAREPVDGGLLAQVSLGRVAPDPQRMPRGTVTILMTDIVQSTEMAERLGDARWAGVLHTHNALVREQLARNEGTEVKVLGDGFMVAFSSARSGVLAAIGIQRALADYGSGHPDTTLAVRVGLHTGEVIEDDGDYLGRNVILAARLAAEAEGGEILASGLVKELTDSAADLTFDEGRDIELRGLSRPWRVHRVTW